MTARDIWYRLPSFLFTALFAFLMIYTPGQIREILIDYQSVPTILLVSSSITTLFFGITLVSLLAKRVTIYLTIDTLIASGPAVIVCIWIGTQVPGAYLDSNIFATAAVLSAYLILRKMLLLQDVFRSSSLSIIATLFCIVAIICVFDVRLLSLYSSAFVIFIFAAGSYVTLLQSILTWPTIGLSAATIMISSLIFDPATSVVRDLPQGDNTYATFSDQFRDWILSRPDLNAYRMAKKPYPVIVNSSEGGGIVAAAQAYAVLSGLQTLCPNFTQHLFASVGVSGGSVGNALFAAKMRDNRSRDSVDACRKPQNFDQIEFASYDLLPPVLSTFLFVDIPNALLPGRLLPSDRATALELAIEASVTDQAASFLRLPIEESWRPAFNVPAQTFVSTRVETGERFMFSPFYLVPVDWYLPSDRSIRVSTAAAISARFPWLTPSARIVDGKSTTTLADGGYYENSGADTALEIIRSIRGLQSAALECGDLPTDCGILKFGNGCQLIVQQRFLEKIDWGCNIVIHLNFLAISNSSAVFSYHSTESPQSFFFDPIYTMLSTRVARGKEAIYNARGHFCSFIGCAQNPSIDIGYYGNVVPSTLLDLPLGWSLSARTFQKIRDFALPINECSYLIAKLDPSAPQPDIPRLYSPEGPAAMRHENACSLATITSLFNLNNRHGDKYYGIQGWPWYSDE